MKAKWIWLSSGEKEDVYGEFIEEFSLVSQATLRISADSEYAVYLNGEYVYSGQYADFPWYKIHDDIDLSPYLGKDLKRTNVLKIVVWFGGDEQNHTHYKNRPALLFSVISNGNVIACSGQDTLSRVARPWASGLKRKMTNQAGYSFRFDLTLKENGLTPSQVVADMPDNTFPRPIKLLERLPFAEAKPIGEGIYDLSRETVGYPFVSINAKKGEKILVVFGEWLPGGHVSRGLPGRDMSFEITAGDGESVVFNPLRKLGCRYLEVLGDCTVNKIGLLPIEYPFIIKEYEVKDKLRKEIYDTAIRTLKLNAFEHYFDCPWREQAFYALDGRLQMMFEYSAFYGSEYQRAALKLMSEDRGKDGLMSLTVPSSFYYPIPSFSFFYIIAMEEYFANSGDDSLLKEYYAKMQSVLDVFIKRLDNGVIAGFFDGRWNFYEWNEGLNGYSAREVEAALNFNAVMAFVSMSNIAKAIGKASDSDKYLALADIIIKRSNELFYNEDKGVYLNNAEDGATSELVNAYAVLSGAATGERAKAICEKLVKNGSFDTQCTLSMLTFKYDALIATDKAKYRGCILKDIDEKYGYMLNEGATSFWETIKGGADFDGGGSLCHGWSALPVLYYRLLGAVR